MARRNQRTTVAVEPISEEETTEMTETEVEPQTTEEPTYDELKARVAELEGQLAAKKGKKKDKPEKRKPDLPDGWIAPVAFRHKLVELGLASDNMSPVQVYSLVRKSQSNGMPVKHFDKEGNEYDEIQTHATTGETLTRPGLKLEAGLEWWKNRPKRQPGKPKATSEGESEATSEDEAAAAEDELSADESFVEAE